MAKNNINHKNYEKIKFDRIISGLIIINIIYNSFKEKRPLK